MVNRDPTAKTRCMPDSSNLIPFRSPLERAHEHALSWLDSLENRPVPPRADADKVIGALGRDLPEGPTPAEEVVDLLATECEPGLVAMPSGRFYGFVIGGSQPAALAADWLVSAWDQNAIMRKVTPAAAAVEEIAAAWFLDLLGLPTEQWRRLRHRCDDGELHRDCLRARRAVLRARGWDLARGLAGSPPVRVLAGRERHASAEVALRYLGLPAAELVDADDEGRAPAGQPRACAGGFVPTRRRSCCCRRATSTREHATRSRSASPWPTSRVPGCTSTARSGCGHPRRRRTATSRPVSSSPTPGRRTRTRR